MKKRWKWWLLFALVLGILIASKRIREWTATTQTNTKNPVVVLDPGHGGADPGKVGVNQAKEKDLNLQIARKVKELLEQAGIEVFLTRQTDEADASKVQDMKNRVKYINDLSPDLVVSIHQNSYTDSTVKGAQVFYFAHSTMAKTLAECMQEVLHEHFSENHRQAKGNETYYLLKKTEVPTIIVECGFLSNPEEAEQLCTDSYQEQMANGICEGVIKGLDKIEKE